jgi:hypothetical protein
MDVSLSIRKQRSVVVSLFMLVEADINMGADTVPTAVSILIALDLKVIRPVIHSIRVAGQIQCCSTVRESSKNRLSFVILRNHHS